MCLYIYHLFKCTIKIQENYIVLVLSAMVFHLLELARSYPSVC